MVEAGDFEGRRAPYAPISALREFFERMRNVGVPSRVDKKFLQKLNVASNNEWALLSALKFLGIVDEHGIPTHAYRLLQTTDRFEDTLRHLVETAYKPVLDMRGLAMSPDDLQNYFRVASSPSQAKNATRFFREVSKLAGMTQAQSQSVSPPPSIPEPSASPNSSSSAAAEPSAQPLSTDTRDLVLTAKAKLLEKLPAPKPEWTAQEYQAICDRFLSMLESLDASSR